MNIETYISEFSKYVIALLMTLYVLEAFFAFRFKSEEKRSGIYLRQTILMFAFHFSGFMVICFETGSVSYLIFYAFQQIVLFAIINLYRFAYPKANRLLINNMCMLLSISFVILTRLNYGKAIRQFLIATGSAAIAIVIPFIVRKFRVLRHFKWIYAGMGLMLLGLMMILGNTTYGSKISYSIGGISFMPMEFVKILFVFYVAAALYNAKTFLDIMMSAIIAAAHVVIQVANKDLGSALIFFVVYICMLFIATGNIIYIILGAGGGAAASIVAFKVFSHIQVRIQAFKDPWSVIDSAGYQITQSLFAISSGGFVGLGLYKGTPSSIPFVTEDFIFSAITEEMGIIFAIGLILVCLNIFIMIMSIAFGLKDKFYQLAAFGMGVTYIFQVFLTIGGGTKFIPLTGVTLPLVSYGGTSVLVSVIMIAIIEGFYLIEQDNKDSVNENNSVKNNRKVKNKVKNRSNIIERDGRISIKPEAESEYSTSEETENEYKYEYDSYEHKSKIEYRPYDETKTVNDYDYEENHNSINYSFDETGEFPFEEIGEIYYNEEEYEKDLKRNKERKY